MSQGQNTSNSRGQTLGHPPEELHRRTLATLGEALFRARTRARLSQEQTALDAGVSVETYCTLERGFTPSGALANPRLTTILRVVNALRVDLQEVSAETCS